jgi:hypothetical protein
VDLELPLLAVDAGILPSWAYGLGVSAGVRVRRLQIAVSGVLWLPQDTGSGEGTYGAHYDRYTGQLSGCYGVPFGRFEVGPCLLVRLEDVTARGSGPRVAPESRPIAWLSVGAAARARWSIAPWAALFARPSVLFATSRPTFAIDGVGPLYQVPVAAVSLELGCEWIL